MFVCSHVLGAEYVQKMRESEFVAINDAANHACAFVGALLPLLLSLGAHIIAKCTCEAD